MSATRSILAPLTTTFTPPAQCSTFGVEGDLSSTLQYWQGQTCSGGFPHDASACWPPALLPVPSPPPNLNGWGLYSPGLHCPVGYYSACTQAVKTDGSPSSLQLGTSFDFQFPLTAGETGIGCCPAGLTCTSTQGYQTCGFIQTNGPIEGLMGFCDTSATTYSVGTEITVGEPYVTEVGNSSSTITLAEVSLYGPLIQIVFKSTDISSLASPTSASPTFTSPVAKNSVPYGSVSTGSPSNPDTDSGGLSTGAKAGIGVGVALGVIALLAIGLFFLLRHRRSRRNNNNMAGPTITPQPNEKSGTYYGQPGQYAQPSSHHASLGSGGMQQWQHGSGLPSPNHQNVELGTDAIQPKAELAAEDLRSPVSGPSTPHLGSTIQDTSRLHSRQSPDASRLSSPRF
ncbi:MAG: hypothetical protein GOMPHAMPRED_003608 [Gomphillus americanus]|uniref:Uncharacterized protein n=1 Tax=Gomphillus americanus TaxID=1940652 RepID=A0A8H3ISF5_9LECA|nr:MAG: hypothetical protein GOMPHAMPRED_003608 [Gomphillus americanus]